MPIQLNDALDRIRDIVPREPMAWQRIQAYMMLSVPLQTLWFGDTQGEAGSLPMRIRPVMILINVAVLVLLGLLGYVAGFLTLASTHQHKTMSI